jgi:RimJ/RimL family protein N-acetyltransferase
MDLFPLKLEGHRVRLEPLSVDHIPALAKAAAESRETYGLTLVPEGEARLREYVDRALEDAGRGLFVPFVTLDLASDRVGARVVGATRFGNLERWTWAVPPPDPRPAGLDAVEIGWTWLAASAQRSHVNSEAKWLMLTHAFEVWRVRRVTLKTDARNLRSRNAIERIGGRFDGILRGHMPAYDGGVRDTAYFSILEAEWPEVKENLEASAARRHA